MFERTGAEEINRLIVARRRRRALAVLLAVATVGGQGVTAFAASPSVPAAAGSSTAGSSTAGSSTAVSSPVVSSPRPSRAQSMAAEQSGAASAGRALGLGSGERLVVKDVISDADGSTHVRYDRTFNGLRVIGGDFVSHRDRSGRVKGVSWNGARQVAVASTKPTLSLASAEAGGRSRASLAQRTTSTTKGELVVYSGRVAGKATKPTARLAYDVVAVGVKADQTPSRLHAIVDASTGATLTSFDEIENGTGNGIYNGGGVTIGTTAGPPWSMRDVAGNVTTDLNGAGNGSGTDISGVPGTTFTDADNTWGNGTVGDRVSAGVDAHYGAEKTFDFYKNVLGRNGIWNTGAGARSRVHYGSSYQNAFWDGTQMTYGDGASNTHPLVELDVAGHEMSHGVTENTAGLVDTGEAAGLNEGTSDIFGTAVEWYANNAADTPDYLIGELVNINGNGTPLRYMDRPSRDLRSPDCWSSTIDRLDPHLSNGPINHWFYLASEGSGAKVVNGVPYNSPTCNASRVTAIGRDKAIKIWYRTLTTYLTSSTTYAAAREGAVQSAKDLYGVTSPECIGTAASFSAIGVPAGATICGTTLPSAGNLLDNPGFESGGTSWSATSNVIGAWGVDQPAHSGTWSAWLGGYGITHNDSITQLVTIPSDASATLTYYAHIDTNETPDAVYDTMTVRAGSTALQTLSNLDAASGYQPRTVDLSAYVGQTIALSFSGAEDAAAATGFVIDDTLVTTPSLRTTPGAPTAVSATPGNAQAAVSWSAPASDGGSPVTGYTVTSSPGGLTATTAGTPPGLTATVPGLTNGTAYTFRVTADNTIGTSPASASSTAVTPKTFPGAPTGVSAVAADTQAVVSWTAPASNGGSAILGYTVRVVNAASPFDEVGLHPSGAGTTSLTLAGPPVGTAYTFQVLATNAVGPGPYSVMSGPMSVAPTAAVTRLSDFNRDGFTDLVARDSGGGLWLYPGNGTGGFQARRQMGTGWNGMSTLVTPGDVTGDGNADLYGRTTAGALWIYPGNGASGFGAKRQVGSGWQSYTIASAADMTGDGRADLLARDASGNLWLYPVAGNAVFQARRSVGVGWNGMSTIVGPGDVSGDLRADILARTTAGALYLYRGNGTGGVAAGTLLSSGWAGMTALVTPGNWNHAVGNDLLARDAAGALWFYPGDNAGHFGVRRAIGSGWGSMTYLG